MKNTKRNGWRPVAPNPCISIAGGCLPPMISYAQNFEDVILRRALQDIEAGFYVDVGAFDGTKDSVTRWFYDRGWRGVNVEPVPAYHANIERERPEDINLRAVVSSESGSTSIYVIDGTGLSTVSADLAKLAEESGYPHSSHLEVPCYSLDELLVTHAGQRTVDFLKIDAEGSESAILQNARFETVRPRIIVVEAVTPFRHEPAWDPWEAALLSRGYTFVYFDGLNRFYLRTEDEDRLQFFGLPPTVFDSFKAHGYSEALDQLSHSQAEMHALSATAQALSSERDATVAERERLESELHRYAESLAAAIREAGVKFEGLARDAEQKLAERDDALEQSLARETETASKLEWREAALEQSLARESEIAGILATREAELDRVRQREKEIDRAWADREVLLERSMARETELSAVLAEREAALATETVKGHELAKERDALAGANTEWRLQLADASLRARDAETERALLAQRLTERSLEIAQSQVTFLTLQRQRDAADDRASCAAAEASSYRDRIACLEEAHVILASSLDDANRRMTELHSTLELVESERASLATRLEEHHSRVIQLEEQWWQLRREIETRDGQLALLTAERDSLSSAYLRYRASSESLELRVAELQHELVSTKTRLSHSEVARETQSALLATSEAEVLSLKPQVARLERELQAANAYTSELEAEWARTAGELDDSSASVRSLQGQLTTLETELQQSARLLDEVTRDRDRTIAALSGVRSERDRMHALLENVTELRDQLSHKAASQETQIHALSSELVTLRSELLMASIRIDAERLRPDRRALLRKVSQ